MFNDLVVFLTYDRVSAHPVCTVIGSIFVKISPDEGEGYITYGRTPTPQIFRVPPPGIIINCPGQTLWDTPIH